MIKENFNGGWKFRRLGEAEFTDVVLPHDAMIYEKRAPGNAGGTNTGWFEGFDYEYVKTFFVPAGYAEKEIVFEFEGVYRNAEVYINGNPAARRSYGYIGFYASASRFLVFGGENEIRVIARNADQPNSRWYSGAGIYRPVTMYISDAKHILLNGIKIRTLSVQPAVIEAEVKTSCGGAVGVRIEKDGKAVSCGSAEAVDGTAVITLKIPDAALWSLSDPALYVLRASFYGDEAEETFGIRSVDCSAAGGFKINGVRVILRGACIHHDNGILGARCYEEAEERKIRILKENGYNAVRSAHNPCSKALLKACDRLGVAVIDEYADMWYIHKTRYDYADRVEKEYEADLADTVAKDFNHPSVVMYSLGNEVAETGQKRGIELFKKMRGVLKKLDGTRPVTVAVNPFFNYLYAPDFKHGAGWISAGSGRINLIGEPLGEALFTRVAFGLTDKPQIAVTPVNRTGERHSPSAWKYTNAMPSWSWNGLDGRRARVEVYSRAPAVALYVNGRKVGVKKAGGNLTFVFRTRYYGGEVRAVNLDKSGRELACASLKTAGAETRLTVIPEKSAVREGEVCFVRIRYTDGNGTVKPLERGHITVGVDGGELLALGNGCPYNKEGFNGNTAFTYYGEAMAVVRAGKGETVISACDGKLTGEGYIKAV